MYEVDEDPPVNDPCVQLDQLSPGLKLTQYGAIQKEMARVVLSDFLFEPREIASSSLFLLPRQVAKQFFKTHMGFQGLQTKC